MEPLPKHLTVDCVRYNLFHSHNGDVYVYLGKEYQYAYAYPEGAPRTQIAKLRSLIQLQPSHRERTRRIHAERAAANRYARRRNGDA